MKDQTRDDGSADTAVQAAVHTDAEGQQKKLKYPKQIGFIISNEFCERFNYYGMRTILVLYLTQKLFMTDDTATMVYHAFSSCVYFFCVFGGIIADSWWGKFKTIVILSFVYAAGSVIISLGAMPPLNLPGVAITCLGLGLIALGSGGIKPCVAAFGGDQFKLPEQAKSIATYFSLFYFAINAGSMISTFITPILRSDVHCFDNQDCYPLAFGVPAVLMLVSIVIFVLGRSMYVSKPPQGNMLVKVGRCIKNARAMKKKEQGLKPREHWLDYAEETDGKQMVIDVKALLNVLVLYIPLPIFWTLFDQQGSRWTFQATRMDGQLTDNFSLKPDQMQVVNPLLILIFIPLYDALIYPLLSKIGIRRPLQKLTLGGILAGLAFIVSAILELQLQDTYAVVPGAGEAQLRIYNGLSCDATVVLPDGNQVIKSLEHYERINFDASVGNLSYTITAGCDQFTTERGVFQVASEMAYSYYVRTDRVVEWADSAEKSSTGYPLVTILSNTTSTVDIVFTDKSDVVQHTVKSNEERIEAVELLPDTYTITVGGRQLGDPVALKLGGVQTFVLSESAIKMNTVSEANSINMLWIVPQFVVMTLGEVMYSVTGLEFSYSQSPESMKSVIQSAWQLTVGVGNLLVVIITGLKFFDSQAKEFFLFAGLMFLDMAIFAVLAFYYKYNYFSSGGEEEGEGGDNNNKDVAMGAIEGSKEGGQVNPSYKDD